VIQIKVRTPEELRKEIIMKVKRKLSEMGYEV
jgi:hypothetical protein